jgi:hypothetical protein
MPTRKQRRRAAKERRHEYETVWVDSEGHELDEPPEDVQDTARGTRDDGKQKAKTQPQQRGGRAVRVPPPPSWQRATRRALILGGVVFALFYLVGAQHGGHNLFGAIEIAVIYTALFIPFTYLIDRFTHNRWQRRAEQQGGKNQPKKR